jgi:hypothetical protein
LWVNSAQAETKPEPTSEQDPDPQEPGDKRVSMNEGSHSSSYYVLCLHYNHGSYYQEFPINVSLLILSYRSARVLHISLCLLSCYSEQPEASLHIFYLEVKFCHLQVHKHFHST